MSDTALRDRGMSILQRELGDVEAERFIMLVNHDNINYTEWRKGGLQEPDTIEELSRTASDYFADVHPDLAQNILKP